MTDEQMNHFCVLKYHKDMLIDVSIEEVMSEIISNIESQMIMFRNINK